MGQYTIEKVSQDEPRLWKGPHGDVYYIKVKLTGVPKPVSIGKKAPDALHEGQTVYGTIEESDLPEDKWKPEAPPQDGGFHAKPDTSTPGPKPAAAQATPRWEDTGAIIRAQWAIGQAKDWALGNDMTFTTIEGNAGVFFAMAERVAQGNPQVAGSVNVEEELAQQQANRDAEHIRSIGREAELDKVHNGDEPINLDDIPF